MTWIWRIVRLAFALSIAALLLGKWYRPSLYHERSNSISHEKELPDVTNIAVITLGEHSRYEQLVNWIGSVHTYSPSTRILVYSRSLLAHEIVALSCMLNVQVRATSPGADSMLAVINDALILFENVLFMSTSVEVRAPLKPVLYVVEKTGAFFVRTSRHINDLISISNKEFKDKNDPYFHKALVSEDIFGVKRGSTASLLIQQPLRECELDTKKCAHAPYLARLSLLVYRTGNICQDPFHFYLEESPLYFDRHPFQAKQPHTFILRKNLDPFPFIATVTYNHAQCITVDAAASLARGTPNAMERHAAKDTRNCVLKGRSAEDRQDCLQPLFDYSSGRSISRFFRHLWGFFVSLFVLLFQFILNFGVEIILFVLLPPRHLLRDSTRRYIVYGLFITVLCVYELQFRYGVAMTPWARTCSSDDEGGWSIGMAYSSVTSPLLLGSIRKIVDCSAPTDVATTFVADPFAIRVPDDPETIYLFYESKDAGTRWLVWNGHAVLSYSTSRDNGATWQYGGLVLREPFHLSYPFVIHHDGEAYMIPETNKAGAVRLYIATRFPDQWALARTLVEGSHFIDSVLVRHEDEWWLFTTVGLQMYIFHSENILGPFIPHKKNPMKLETPRLGGRIIHSQNHMLRFAQGRVNGLYGSAVRVYKITHLTATEYREVLVTAPNPLLQLGTCLAPWCSRRMHHIDLGLNNGTHHMAFVDGD